MGIEEYTDVDAKKSELIKANGLVAMLNLDNGKVYYLNNKKGSTMYKQPFIIKIEDRKTGKQYLCIESDGIVMNAMGDTFLIANNNPYLYNSLDKSWEKDNDGPLRFWLADYTIKILELHVGKELKSYLTHSARKPELLLESTPVVNQ